MRFTDKDGRELTVEFMRDPKDVFGNNIDHDPSWAEEVLRFGGDEMLEAWMRQLLRLVRFKIDEPFHYVSICKLYPRDAVLKASIAMGLTPDRSVEDWTDDDTLLWDELYRSRVSSGHSR